MDNFGLYIVMTSPLLGYGTFTEICVQEEVPMLQIRDKHLSDRELLNLCKRLKAITEGSKTRFIVDDRPDICLLTKADGLHLGQDDLPWKEVLPFLPNNTLLGVSTHNLKQAKELMESITAKTNLQKPDYFSFGPIYPTVAKEKPDPAIGVEDLKNVLNLSPIPVVAIGGLFPETLPNVLAVGAQNMAFIRHFTLSRETAELKAKIREMKSLLKEAQK